ncbi:ribonuclease III [Peniophora sp. CONT]|nr:ribonuclease III [Peniophora sp. CONT]
MSALVPDSLLDLPPLPELANEEMYNRVFTHRSLYARPTHVFEDSPQDPSPDNEMLEHLGDQVLGLVITDLIQELYPYLRVGPSTKMRALVVGNQTLATVALRYRLPDRLRLHRSQSVTLKASMNVQADVFESYVGGLYRARGLALTQAWLRVLFTPYVRAAYRQVRAQHGLPPSLSVSSSGSSQTSSSGPYTPPPSPPHGTMIGHLGLFNQRIQQANRSVEWVFVDSLGEGTKSTPVWVARAIVGGEEWGSGRGNTKKTAKNEAAKVGLRRLGYTQDN